MRALLLGGREVAFTIVTARLSGSLSGLCGPICWGFTAWGTGYSKTPKGEGLLPSGLGLCGGGDESGVFGVLRDVDAGVAERGQNIYVILPWIYMYTD